MVRRPVGVTLVACSLGLIMALLLAALIGLGLTLHTTVFSTVAILALPAFFVAAMMVWLGLTLGGLLRMKPGARTSMQVLAALSLILAAGDFLIALLLWMFGKELDGRSGVEMLAYHLGTVLPGAFFLGLGVWWIVYFSRRPIVVLFQPAWLRPGVNPSGAPWIAPSALREPGPHGPYGQRKPGRFDHVPGSIQVMGWLLLIGAAGCLIVTFLPLPVFLLGTIVDGWPGHLLWAVLAVISGLSGWGLLRLDPRARKLTYAYVGFGCVSNLVNLTQRSIDHLNRYVSTLLAAWHLPAQPAIPFVYTRAMLAPSVVLGLALYAVALYFLHKHRNLFRSRQTSA